MLYIVLPLHWKDAGLTALYQVGILLSVNRFIRLPFNPLAAWLLQRIGLRNGIIIAVALAGVITLGYGYLHGFWIWLVLRCLWGMSWTLLRLGAFLTIVQLTDNNKHGYHMGLYNGLFRIGSLVGMLAGALLTELISLTAAAAVFSIITVLSLPFVIRYVPAANMEVIQKGQSVLNPLISVAGRDTFLILTLLSGLSIAMIYQGFFTSTLSHLIDANMSVLYIWGIPIGAAVLAALLQAARWGWEPWLAPWIGQRSDSSRHRPVILTVILAMASVLFVLIPMKMPASWWLCLLLGVQVTATLLTTLADAIAAEAASHSLRAFKITLYSFMLDLGAAIGPLLGYLLDNRSLYTAAAIILLLLALSWRLVPQREQLKPDSQEV
jgi:MFS family permease